MIVIITILFGVIFFFYKRMINRELKKEMTGQVSEMVGQYIAFYEQKNSKQNPTIDNE